MARSLLASQLATLERGDDIIVVPAGRSAGVGGASSDGGGAQGSGRGAAGGGDETEVGAAEHAGRREGARSEMVRRESAGAGEAAARCVEDEEALVAQRVWDAVVVLLQQATPDNDNDPDEEGCVPPADRSFLSDEPQR